MILPIIQTNTPTTPPLPMRPKDVIAGGGIAWKLFLLQGTPT